MPNMNTGAKTKIGGAASTRKTKISELVVDDHTKIVQILFNNIKQSEVALTKLPDDLALLPWCKNIIKTS